MHQQHRTSPRIFLLSPANTGGARAKMLFRPEARFDLAERVRNGGASIAEVYSFISGLYFRGKVAYARAFAAAPAMVAPSLVITPGRGLLPLETRLSADDLSEIATVPVDLGEPRYCAPLERDALALHKVLPAECCVVLLGSIATPKYCKPLLDIFGHRLLFPADFVGRGDMSRGGLMLRAADSRQELEYVPVAGAILHGARPPKLPRLRHRSSEAESLSRVPRHAG
jgi:hypothetical protein